VGAPSQDELEELHLKPVTRTGIGVLYPDTSISQKYAYYKRLFKMTEIEDNNAYAFMIGCRFLEHVT